jgi:hypothetical protein
MNPDYERPPKHLEDCEPDSSKRNKCLILTVEDISITTVKTILRELDCMRINYDFTVN